jgi:hypothetical protein
MGYNTEFKGKLKFKTELTTSQLAKVNSFLGEDCRDHPEWEGSTGLYYVDLVLLDDFSGLQWNSETEKTYQLDEIINMLIKNIRKEIPDFSLEGKLLAQGDDIDDRWELIMENGIAIKKDLPHTSSKIECPMCKSHFYL